MGSIGLFVEIVLQRELSSGGVWLALGKEFTVFESKMKISGGSRKVVTNTFPTTSHLSGSYLNRDYFTQWAFIFASAKLLFLAGIKIAVMFLSLQATHFIKVGVSLFGKLTDETREIQWT